MPKVRSKRFESHTSSVKLPGSKGQSSNEDPELATAEYKLERAQILKKKDKHQSKREAFLQKLQLTQSPYSKSHQRRLKRKANEQIGQGLQDIQDELQLVDDRKGLLTIAQDATATAGMQTQVDVGEDTAKSVQQSKITSNQIGEGKGSTLTAAQRKKALKTERLRHPLVLSNTQFASNPFETIRIHARNTLVKHVPT